MSGRDDLKAAMRAVMAARREQLGEPPTPEELLDYRDGRLDDAERETIEAKIAAFPDAARALADLAAFPEVEPAEGVGEVSDEQLAARWESFRERLGTGEARRAEVIEIATRRKPAPGPRPSFSWLAAAASLAFAVGLGSGLMFERILRKPPPAINVTIAQLAPAGTGAERSGEPTVVEVPESAEGWVLVLGLVDGLAEAEYSVSIVDSRGVEVWSAAGLRPTPAGTFHLAFRRGFLPSGDYRLLLSDREAELAAYAFRLIRE